MTKEKNIMVCTYCNNVIEDSALFCPYCGNAVVKRINPYKSPQETKNPKKYRLLGVVIAISSLVVIGSLIVAVLMLIELKNTNNKDINNNTDNRIINDLIDEKITEQLSVTTEKQKTADNTEQKDKEEDKAKSIDDYKVYSMYESIVNYVKDGGVPDKHPVQDEYTLMGAGDEKSLYSIFDIDKDGRSELLINLGGRSDTADAFYIFECSPKTDKARLELYLSGKVEFTNDWKVISYEGNNKNDSYDDKSCKIFEYDSQNDVYKEMDKTIVGDIEVIKDDIVDWHSVSDSIFDSEIYFEMIKNNVKSCVKESSVDLLYDTIVNENFSSTFQNYLELGNPKFVKQKSEFENVSKYACYVNKKEVLSFSGAEGSTFTYHRAQLDNVTIAGIYPGMEVKQAEKILDSIGLIHPADSNTYYTAYYNRKGYCIKVSKKKGKIKKIVFSDTYMPVWNMKFDDTGFDYNNSNDDSDDKKITEEPTTSSKKKKKKTKKKNKSKSVDECYLVDYYVIGRYIMQEGLHGDYADISFYTELNDSNGDGYDELYMSAKTATYDLYCIDNYSSAAIVQGGGDIGCEFKKSALDNKIYYYSIVGLNSHGGEWYKTYDNKQWVDVCKYEYNNDIDDASGSKVYYIGDNICSEEEWKQYADSLNLTDVEGIKFDLGGFKVNSSPKKYSKKFETHLNNLSKPVNKLVIDIDKDGKDEYLYYINQYFDLWFESSENIKKEMEQKHGRRQDNVVIMFDDYDEGSRVYCIYLDKTISGIRAGEDSDIELKLDEYWETYNCSEYPEEGFIYNVTFDYSDSEMVDFITEKKWYSVNSFEDNSICELAFDKNNKCTKRVLKEDGQGFSEISSEQYDYTYVYDDESNTDNLYLGQSGEHYTISGNNIFKQHELEEYETMYANNDNDEIYGSYFIRSDSCPGYENIVNEIFEMMN